MSGLVKTSAPMSVLALLKRGVCWMAVLAIAVHTTVTAQGTEVADVALPENARVVLFWTGELKSVARNLPPGLSKSITVTAVLSPKSDNGIRQFDYVLQETGGGGWSWREQIGRRRIVVAADGDAAVHAATDAATGTKTAEYAAAGDDARISVLHTHEQIPSEVELPALFAGFGPFVSGSKGRNGDDAWEIGAALRRGTVDFWPVSISGRPGRSSRLLYRGDLGVLTEAVQSTFLGQGHEYELKMKLDAARIPTEADAPLLRVMELLQALNQSTDGSPIGNSSTAEQRIDDTDARVTALVAAAQGTPLDGFVRNMRTTLRNQRDAAAEMAQLRNQLVGKMAPRLKPAFIPGTEPTPEDFARIPDNGERREMGDTAAYLADARVTVLHFWTYSPEPFVEPFGQVGYLDFLYSSRRDSGVRVVGVVVDRRDESKTANTNPVTRGALQFRKMMNFSYPLVVDDGALLAAVGDPRRFGGTLPLWVVIDANGKIAEVHAGLLAVDPQKGLAELDATVAKLLSDSRDAVSPAPLPK